jgi:hypothetical protein
MLPSVQLFVGHYTRILRDRLIFALGETAEEERRIRSAFNLLYGGPCAGSKTLGAAVVSLDAAISHSCWFYCATSISRGTSLAA